MISRYALYDIANISTRFHLPSGLPKGVKPNYNISPTTSAAVIMGSEGTRILQRMQWGLVAQGAKDTNSVFRYKTYNIPSENIFSRHSWGRAVRESRCLVPANGFYQLDESGEKHAYYVQPHDKSLLAFAGVYSSWQDPQGVVHGTYSVITIEANQDMPHSSSRMPIIIKPEDESRWLDPAVSDVNSLYDMLRPSPSGLLTTQEVSAAVYSPKLNQPGLIDPIEKEDI